MRDDSFRAFGVRLEGDPYEVDADDDMSAPTWDDEDYPLWAPETSRIISGPIGERARFHGTRHPDWQSAKAYVQSKYTMLKFGCLPGRWFARIKVVKP